MYGSEVERSNLKYDVSVTFQLPWTNQAIALITKKPFFRLLKFKVD